MMYEREKSDSSIVVKTSGNKPAQAGADLAERREEAKGNAQRLNMRRTQSRESVSQQLERVRKAYTLRRQTPKVGARCVNHARRDLCGGLPVMEVPTAIAWGKGRNGLNWPFLTLRACCQR